MAKKATVKKMKVVCGCDYDLKMNDEPMQTVQQTIAEKHADDEAVGLAIFLSLAIGVALGIVLDWYVIHG